MHDAELDDLRAVNCRVVLEHAGWELDKAGSSPNAVKYRGGQAQIVIVTHHGKAWFDPLGNDTRGDVIALVQYIWGGTIGHARKVLRPLAGVSPPSLLRATSRPAAPPLPPAPAWHRAQALVPGSQGWTYLTDVRRIPADTLHRVIGGDLLREGIYGTAWALHRTPEGVPSGWEMRGPKYKGFSKGGHKALFWTGDPRAAKRLAVAESWIDALSLASIEAWPSDSAYLSTGGGFGPATAAALAVFLGAGRRLVAATDRGHGGELLAERLHEIAQAAGSGYSRKRPDAKDWNAELSGI